MSLGIMAVFPTCSDFGTSSARFIRGTCDLPRLSSPWAYPWNGKPWPTRFNGVYMQTSWYTIEAHANPIWSSSFDKNEEIRSYAIHSWCYFNGCSERKSWCYVWRIIGDDETSVVYLSVALHSAAQLLAWHSRWCPRCSASSPLTCWSLRRKLRGDCDKIRFSNLIT